MTFFEKALGAVVAVVLVIVTIGGAWSLLIILFHALMHPWLTLKYLAAFWLVGAALAIVGEMLSGASHQRRSR